MQPVTPKQKWRAITITTIVLLPCFWSILAGLVAAADEGNDGPDPAASIAFGLALLPFVFVVGAFLSQHPRASSAAAKAMGMALLVGIPASALAADAVTGLVAGVGAGGIIVMRQDGPENWKTRAIAIAFASVYTAVIVRTAGPIALISAPVFPFTAIGLADHWSVRSASRHTSATSEERSETHEPSAT
ncbi:MAG: hypothetical protein AB7L17_23140 [Ilumatobacteraceae bacterium]